MSRIPQSRSPSKPPSRSLIPPPSAARAGSPSKVSASASSSSRIGTKSVPKTPTKSPANHPPPIENDPPMQKAPVSIKEAIALKRAEARKATAKASGGGGGLESIGTMEDALPVPRKTTEDDNTTDLGRWSIKETIDRARSTGSINLSTRSLPCLPSALFEIHLGVTPDPLKSVANEPPISSSTDVPGTPRRGGRRDAPTWFEAQDLHVLKAWSNDIVEIQHEISLFGSLKTIDLHKNKLVSLPETFADLMSLTTLDLSHNALSSLPSNLFALPNLTYLDLSHNGLTSLPFTAPFSDDIANSRSRSSYGGGGSFFTPIVTRASAPLPRLLTLDVSHNKLSAASIDQTPSSLPAALSKVDLSANPLGLGDPRCRSLIRALSGLQNITQLRLAAAEIDDAAFATDLSLPEMVPFPKLRLLDLGETRVSAVAVTSAFQTLSQDLSFDVTTEEPAEGTLRVILGKKIIKEAWEVEAERKAKLRTAKNTDSGQPTSNNNRTAEKPVQVVKESWEVEAEQGLLTEGGRRRARAAAAASAGPSHSSTDFEAAPSSDIPSSTASLANPQYFSQQTQSLTLPPSAAPSKSHNRAFSLASSWSTRNDTSNTTDLVVPTPTLPLAVIASQPFAQTLRVLILTNRKKDLSFSLPLPPEGVCPDDELLPKLEELSLEGCGFGDSVSVSRHQALESGMSTPPRSHELLLPLLARLFPSLLTLDLSYNALTTASLKAEALSQLVLADSAPDGSQKRPRKGLKHLRLRGNRFTELDGFQSLAELFKGNRAVPTWKLDELDIRENEIGKLPPELGLLPLDVFLVDGNLFRVPQRRVWEREGTKGLLSWLRGRIE